MNCNNLLTAIEYYKWDTSDKNTSYIDSLICQSCLDKWQKFAIMHILGSDVRKCITCICDEKNLRESKCKEEFKAKQFVASNQEHNSKSRAKLLDDYISKFLSPSYTLYV